MSAGTKTYLIAPSPESALTVDVQTRGLRKQKHLFFFESYRGDLAYDPEDPTTARINLEIDATSVCCKTASEKPRGRTKLTRVARDLVLKTHQQPAITLISTAATSKPLRGYVVVGDLRIGDVTRSIRVNVVFGTPKNNRVLVEGDATVRLSDFSLHGPHMLMGLVKASDNVLLRAILWCTEGQTISKSTTT